VRSLAARRPLISTLFPYTTLFRSRVGAGGIMLPNHSPLQVAEQFGTLAALHPGRIDLGVGRAPGTDHATARALRRYFDSAEQFRSEEHTSELQSRENLVCRLLLEK